MSDTTVPERPSTAEVLRKRARGILNLGVNPLVSLLARLGVTPNVVSLTGFAITVLAVWPLATGHFLTGGLVLLGGSATDVLDGALARATGTVSKRGGLLDSTLDRISEAVVLFGLLYFFTDRSSTEESLLVFAVLATSVLVSYVKARAEGLGIQCNVGAVTRPERIALLSAGLIVDQITVFLYVLAITSFLTASHRFVHAWGQAGKR